MMAHLNITTLTEPDLEIITANILTEINDNYINN